VQNRIEINRGIYILEIHAEYDFTLSTKAFGKVELPKGYYYYVGSAQKNLRNRIQRHLKKEKNIHWHIDFLTSAQETRITKICILPFAPKSEECATVQRLLTFKFAHYIIEGFGSSDCHICKSHLLYSPKKITQSQFTFLYQSIVCLIPSSNDIS